MSTEEPNDMPRPHSLPYERHRRDPDRIALEQQQEAQTVDPARWNPARLGLRIIFWGWVAILCMIAVFTVVWLAYFFKYLTNDDAIHTAGRIVKGVVLVGLLASFVGQCICVMVPQAAAARRWIVAAVAGNVAFALCVILLFTLPRPAAPAPAAPPAAKADEEAKPAVPPPQEGGVKPPAPAPRPPSFKLHTELPGMTVPRALKTWLLATYVVSQIFFVMFLKRVALFFHNQFLAETTGGYLTLLILHAAILALLPPAALVACFFWVIMLGLEFVIAIWFLVMVRGTGKALG